MKNKSINYLLMSMLSIMIFIFGLTFIKNMNSSYAYEVNRPNYPTSTFNSNFNGNKVNYINDALNANGDSSNLSNSFSVANNMKTSSGNNTLYLLQRKLDVPTTTEKFEINAENPTTINDRGLMYIFSHGYNSYNSLDTIFTATSKYGTANNEKKYYVTQIAIWLYLAEKETSFSEICQNNACKFFQNNNSPTNDTNKVRDVIKECSKVNGYEFLEYIIDLVDKAKSYRGEASNSKISSSNPNSTTYTINDDFSLLTTSLSSPTITSNNDNFMYYTFEIEDPDNVGVYLTDNNNNRLSESDKFNTEFSFKINAPLKSNLESNNLSNIKIHIIGHFVTDTPIKNYHVTTSPNSLILPAPDKSQKYSNVLLAYTQDYVSEIIYSLENFVTISKVDITNSKELPGAKLKITKKDNDETVEEWTSSSKPRYIFLDNGEYKLCETEAPNGYKLKTECINFSVDGTHIVSVKMENEPTVNVEVPNTNSFINKLKYIIGFLLICFGIGIFTFTYNNQKNTKKSIF